MVDDRPVITFKLGSYTVAVLFLLHVLGASPQTHGQLSPEVTEVLTNMPPIRVPVYNPTLIRPAINTPVTINPKDPLPVPPPSWARTAPQPGPLRFPTSQELISQSLRPVQPSLPPEALSPQVPKTSTNVLAIASSSITTNNPSPPAPTIWNQPNPLLRGLHYKW